MTRRSYLHVGHMVTDHEFQAATVRQIRRRFGLSVKEFLKAVKAGRLKRDDQVVWNCLDNLRRAGLTR